MQQHMSEAGINHHGLNDIFNDSRVPSVLTNAAPPQHLSRQDVPTAEQWQSTFCGLSPDREQQASGDPMNVCLHKEEAQTVQAKVAFDVHSFMGFATSLAVARQGLWYQPAPHAYQNLTADLHIETDVFLMRDTGGQAQRPSQAPPREIPHLCLDRLVGDIDVTVYVLFPYLPLGCSKFHSMTVAQLSRWRDKVFHPAVYHIYDSHYVQHLPSSYSHAAANSRARQVEGRQVNTAGYQTEQHIGFCLQPGQLDSIWMEVLNITNNTPGLADFSEPEIFLNAKGTKLQIKTSASDHTMLGMMRRFKDTLQGIINPQFLCQERFYVDTGKEICCRASSLPEQA